MTVTGPVQGRHLRAMPILRDAGITAKIIRMEPYKDPDEFIKNLGAEAFEERIASCEKCIYVQSGILEKDYDMNSPEGKTEFMKETARRLLHSLKKKWNVIIT